MRAPRPTAIDREAIEVILDAIDREAIEVILDALNRWDVRMMRKQDDAVAWASSPEAEQWFADTIATAEERDQIARGLARRARRRRGKLKGKRGNYPRSRGTNYWVARVILPLVLQALHGHFHDKHVPVTKTWAIELTAYCLGLDEDGIRYFLKKGRRRPS